MVATCRSCNAPVMWVKTAAGKKMPLDPEPDDERGNVALADVGEAEPVAQVLSGAVLEETRGEEPLYLSHFATCPDAGQHRIGRPT